MVVANLLTSHFRRMIKLNERVYLMITFWEDN